MINFETILPKEKQSILTEFLLGALKFNNISVKAIDQDCSTRVYYRIKSSSESFIMMDSSLESQSFFDFIKVQRILTDIELTPPKIIHADINNMLLLLEDFGDYSLKPYLEKNPNNKVEFYKNAIELLIKLHSYGASKELNYYSEDVLLNGLRKSVIKSYLPSIHPIITSEEAGNELEQIFASLLKNYASIKKVIVLRDYHAENLMVLDNKTLGVIDFQDAMNGSATYDILSLLEDARIDVSSNISSYCINYYLERSNCNIEEFKYYYSVLSAQRNLRIIGLFHKFGYLDNKIKYKKCLPRVINYLNIRLQDPILQDLSKWCIKYKILDNDSII